MAIDNEMVKKIAFLSHLKIEDSKIEETKEEFNKIIDWVEMLNEVDTDGVAPLVSVNDSNLLLREDIVMEGNQAGAVLKNAPQSQYGYFTVPKVVE